jgi:hypothetical protein
MARIVTGARSLVVDHVGEKRRTQVDTTAANGGPGEADTLGEPTKHFVETTTTGALTIMFIAVRQGKNGSWALVEETTPDPSPDAPPIVVPVGQMVELIPGVQVAMEEFELPGSRVIDVVGVDARGDLTLGVTRLAQSPEIRQVCISRLLELASVLRREVPFREFEQRILLLQGRPLDDLVHDALPEKDRAAFDPRAFRLRLAQNLEQGRFRLVLAVDRVTEELDSFLDFLRYSSEGTIRFEPMELALFRCGGVQVMVPRITAQEEPLTEVVERETARPSFLEVLRAREEELEDEDDDYDGDAYEDRSAYFEALDDVDPHDTSSDPLERIYEYLRAEEREDAEAGFTVSEGEFSMSVHERQGHEDLFLDRLKETCTRDGHRRAQRLVRLGREPNRTLPAGWIGSTDVLSFQAGFFRDGTGLPEPQVAEIFRLESDGTMILDLPLLRVMISDLAVEGFLRDLASNEFLSGALADGGRRLEVHLDKAFAEDHDVRTFCVAVRKLVLGLGILGNDWRDAA